MAAAGPDQRASAGVERDRNKLDLLLSSVALVVLAVSQPVLDLLGRNPEFFLAHHAPRLDIVLFAFLVGVAVPLLVGGGILLVHRLWPRLGRFVHGGLIFSLTGGLALQIGRQLGLSVPLVTRLVAAVVVGLALMISYSKWGSVRSLLSIAAVSVVVAPALFLLASPTNQLLTESTVTIADVRMRDPAPIVLLVFDELPLASLIDSDGELQSDLYPGFSRLLEDATWFRNAVTTQRLTQFAVPAILSGVNPTADLIPTVADYPGNLFTLVCRSYDIDSLESMTALYPSEACGQEETTSTAPFVQRWTTLLHDVRIVSAYVLLPPELIEDLPPIDQAWADFAAGDPTPEWDSPQGFSDNEDIAQAFRVAVRDGRGATTEAFIRGIEPPIGRPTLDFAHVLLPHSSWEYLPNGKRFVPPRPIPGSDRSAWLDDEWLVRQAYQLHLVQVQYVDHLVGETIRHLEKIGTYDESLVVVVADHGIVFRAGVDNRREATPESVGEIAAVPLFIKPPLSSGGGIDDYRAEIIDIAPTIAGLLGTDLPWETDGVDLFADNRPNRNESVIVGGGTVTFGAGGEEKLAVAARKMDAFPDGDPWKLTPPGTQHLLGARLPDLTVEPGDRLRARLETADEYASLDLDAETLPVLVQGVVTGVTDGEEVNVAIAVNDTIAAITRTYRDEDLTRFYALLPPSVLVDGSNTIDLLSVATGDDLKLIGP